MDWVGLGWVWDGMGWDLCAGLFYEHRFAMLISSQGGNGRIRDMSLIISNLKMLKPYILHHNGDCAFVTKK